MPIPRISTTLSQEVLLPAIREAVRDGSFLLTVTGTSMVPTLRSGQSVVELTAPTQPPRRGQILLFTRLDGTCVLHRCVRVGKDGTLTINGDAQTWVETIRAEQVIARVSRFQRTRRWYSCDGLPGRLWAWLWPLTRPLRPKLFAALHRCTHPPRGGA